LILVVDGKSSDVPYASEVAEVGRRAILPKQGVVLNRDAALSREADGLALVVNRHGLSVRGARERGEFLDVAVSPDDSLSLENWGLAGWVSRGILRRSDHPARTPA